MSSYFELIILVCSCELENVLITVRDCEAIRAALTAHREDKRWSVLGQSFGGFASITYLSFAYSLCPRF